MEQFRARQVSESALPVIDITGLRSADPADRLAVGAEIGGACRGLGFMYISGHGVPADLRAGVFEEAARFFGQSEHDKLAVHMNRSPCNRGYEPMGHQTLEAGTPPDLKEGFYIAEDMDEDHPRVRAGHFNFGPNQWAAGMPGFRSTMSRYHGEMLTLGSLLMTGIALSLDLEEDFFADYCSDPLSRLRLLHYPPQPANPHPGEKGCGAHTDFGGITILMQDDNGGLQVMGSDGDWIHAPPIPDTYLVNMGDLIARWTNDRYRSTVHRVVNLSGRDRYSVPFFLSGSPDHPIVALPTCLDADETPRYPPTTVDAHTREMYARTYVAPAG